MNEFRGARYGEAGGNLGGASQRFGRDNARAGASGEKYLGQAVRRNPRTKQYMLYQSLRMPTPQGQKRYSAELDIDFAMASGNKVVLIDCKRWSSKFAYWSLFGTLMKGLTPADRLSKNMLMARERVRKMLPGHQVEAIVCFVPVKGGRLPKSVGFLFWPGGIRSYMPNDGMNKIAKILGEPSAPSAKTQGLLGNLTR